MTDPHDIIAANTRGGHTSWQNVARQLGRSVDSVRAQFDPGYERAHVWAPSRDPIPQPRPEDVVIPFDENDTSSPYVRGPGLKAEILCLLSRHAGLSVDDIASHLQRPVLSVRKRLNVLREEGRVTCSGRHPSGSPKTWRRAVAAVTRHGLGDKERV